MNERLHAVELRPGRALLVVADAGVDQHRVAPGLDDEAVKAEHQFAGRRIDQPIGAEQVAVGPHDFGIEVGEEFLGREERAFVIGDAGDLEAADPGGLHGAALFHRCSCRKTSLRR